MTQIALVTDGLQFPEGPVVLPNGHLVVTELHAGTVTRIDPDGYHDIVAHLGGSPNGAALGPDGALYVCNSGGWRWTELGGMLIPGDHHGTQSDDYIGGRIQRLDLNTGEYADLYTECDGRALCAPNDLVFDASGGFWFTDHGHIRNRDRDRTGVFYAHTDGSSIREVIFPLDAPNGIGLSPDGTRLYVAETHTGRVWWWEVTGPGEVNTAAIFGNGGTLLAGLPGHQLLDSLAVDAEGWVCVATLINGGITSISPDGAQVEHLATDDLITTNICFGGDDLRTAYITCSATGRLVSTTWSRPGLALAF